jgi:hypothetical protein
MAVATAAATAVDATMPGAATIMARTAAPTAPTDRGQGRGGGRAEESNKHQSVAAALGGLNAAHASPNARENASANSKVGQIAAYEKQMLEAQAIKDPAQRAAAQAEARMTLERAANKPVTDDVVARVNELLGLGPVKP